MGTELGRTSSAKEPKCVGEVLRFVNEGRGGCKTTQTCCCPPPGGEEMLLLLLFWLKGKLRSPSGLSWLSILSTEKIKKHGMQTEVNSQLQSSKVQYVSCI